MSKEHRVSDRVSVEGPDILPLMNGEHMQNVYIHKEPKGGKPVKVETRHRSDSLKSARSAGGLSVFDPNTTGSLARDTEVLLDIYDIHEHDAKKPDEPSEAANDRRLSSISGQGPVTVTRTYVVGDADGGPGRVMARVTRDTEESQESGAVGVTTEQGYTSTTRASSGRVSSSASSHANERSSGHSGKAHKSSHAKEDTSQSAGTSAMAEKAGLEKTDSFQFKSSYNKLVSASPFGSPHGSQTKLNLAGQENQIAGYRRSGEFSTSYAGSKRKETNAESSEQSTKLTRTTSSSSRGSESSKVLAGGEAAKRTSVSISMGSDGQEEIISVTSESGSSAMAVGATKAESSRKGSRASTQSVTKGYMAQTSASANRAEATRRESTSKSPNRPASRTSSSGRTDAKRRDSASKSPNRPTSQISTSSSVHSSQDLHRVSSSERPERKRRDSQTSLSGKPVSPKRPIKNEGSLSSEALSSSQSIESQRGRSRQDITASDSGLSNKSSKRASITGGRASISLTQTSSRSEKRGDAPPVALVSKTVVEEEGSLERKHVSDKGSDKSNEDSLTRKITSKTSGVYSIQAASVTGNEGAGRFTRTRSDPHLKDVGLSVAEVELSGMKSPVQNPEIKSQLSKLFGGNETSSSATTSSGKEKTSASSFKVTEMTVTTTAANSAKATDRHSTTSESENEEIMVTSEKRTSLSPGAYLAPAFTPFDYRPINSSQEVKGLVKEGNVQKLALNMKDIPLTGRAVDRSPNKTPPTVTPPPTATKYKFAVEGIDIPAPPDEFKDEVTTSSNVSLNKEDGAGSTDSLQRQQKQGFTYLLDRAVTTEIKKRADDVTSRKPHEVIEVKVHEKSKTHSGDSDGEIQSLRDARAKLQRQNKAAASEARNSAVIGSSGNISVKSTSSGHSNEVSASTAIDKHTSNFSSIHVKQAVSGNVRSTESTEETVSLEKQQMSPDSAYSSTPVSPAIEISAAPPPVQVVTVQRATVETSKPSVATTAAAQETSHSGESPPLSGNLTGTSQANSDLRTEVHKATTTHSFSHYDSAHGGDANKIIEGYSETKTVSSEEKLTPEAYSKTTVVEHSRQVSPDGQGKGQSSATDISSSERHVQHEYRDLTSSEVSSTKHDLNKTGPSGAGSSTATIVLEHDGGQVRSDVLEVNKVSATNQAAAVGTHDTSSSDSDSDAPAPPVPDTRLRSPALHTAVIPTGSWREHKASQKPPLTEDTYAVQEKRTVTETKTTKTTTSDPRRGSEFAGGFHPLYAHNKTYHFDAYDRRPSKGGDLRQDTNALRSEKLEINNNVKRDRERADIIEETVEVHTDTIDHSDSANGPPISTYVVEEEHRLSKVLSEKSSDNKAQPQDYDYSANGVDDEDDLLTYEEEVRYTDASKRADRKRSGLLVTTVSKGEVTSGIKRGEGNYEPVSEERVYQQEEVRSSPANRLGKITVTDGNIQVDLNQSPDVTPTEDISYSPPYDYNTYQTTKSYDTGENVFTLRDSHLSSTTASSLSAVHDSSFGSTSPNDDRPPRVIKLRPVTVDISGMPLPPGGVRPAHGLLSPNVRHMQTTMEMSEMTGGSHSYQQQNQQIHYARQPGRPQRTHSDRSNRHTRVSDEPVPIHNTSDYTVERNAQLNFNVYAPQEKFQRVDQNANYESIQHGTRRRYKNHLSRVQLEDEVFEVGSVHSEPGGYGAPVRTSSQRSPTSPIRRMFNARGQQSMVKALDIAEPLHVNLPPPPQYPLRSARSEGMLAVVPTHETPLLSPTLQNAQEDQRGNYHITLKLNQLGSVAPPANMGTLNRSMHAEEHSMTTMERTHYGAQGSPSSGPPNQYGTRGSPRGSPRATTGPHKSVVKLRDSPRSQQAVHVGTASGQSHTRSTSTMHHGDPSGASLHMAVNQTMTMDYLPSQRSARAAQEERHTTVTQHTSSSNQRMERGRGRPPEDEVDQYRSNEDLPQVVRGSILIKNAIDTTGAPKVIDVVETDDMEEDLLLDDNTNLFHGRYFQSRENPMYSSDEDLRKAGRKKPAFTEIFQRSTREEHVQHEDGEKFVEIPVDYRNGHTETSKKVKVKRLKKKRSRRQEQYANNGYDEGDGGFEETVTQQSSNQSHSAQSRRHEGSREVRKTNWTETEIAKLIKNAPPDSVRQRINVEREEEEILGPLPLNHADGSNTGPDGLLNFDTVSEVVDLGVAEGIAQLAVKVRCERVVPIRGVEDMFKKSSVIVTRLIEIDLDVTPERRHLLENILRGSHQLALGDGSQQSSGGGRYNSYGGQRVKESRLSTKDTFKLYKTFMGLAEMDDSMKTHGEKVVVEKRLEDERTPPTQSKHLYNDDHVDFGGQSSHSHLRGSNDIGIQRQSHSKSHNHSTSNHMGSSGGGGSSHYARNSSNQMRKGGHSHQMYTTNYAEDADNAFGDEIQMEYDTDELNRRQEDVQTDSSHSVILQEVTAGRNRLRVPESDTISFMSAASEQSGGILF